MMMLINTVLKEFQAITPQNIFSFEGDIKIDLNCDCSSNFRVFQYLSLCYRCEYFNVSVYTVRHNAGGYCSIACLVSVVR